MCNESRRPYLLGLVYKTTSGEKSWEVKTGVKGTQKAYNVKIIETPTTKEIWLYNEPILYVTDKETDKKEKRTRKSYDELSAQKQYDSLKRKQNHYQSMRWEIARLVDCNFDHHTKFITLTFKQNIVDVAYANNEFKKFIKRLNYFLYKQNTQELKYIATWEKQKRGAIHYHIIFFDFPFVRKRDLETLWSHGFVDIKKIHVDSKENMGRYISKYFSKDLDLKEYKKKAFFKSQNLKLPKISKLIVYDPKAFQTDTEDIVFSKEYNRKTYISGTFRRDEDLGYRFKDTPVTYIKIRK